MEKTFREYLNDNIVVFDGGIGTEIYKRGVYINQCFDELNLSAPKLIKEIHKSYVDSGADVITTNTFGGNEKKLSPHGYGEDVYEINYRGAKIAKESAGDKVYVAGSIGPLGEKIEPWGKIATTEAREIFREQAQALLDGGVDLFIAETFTRLSPLKQAVLGIKDITDIPVIAEITITEELLTPIGTPLKKVAAEAGEWDIDSLGINCSVGPEAMLEALETLAQYTSHVISVMPNAGKPRDVEGRNIYLVSPDYMAEYAKRFVSNGAGILGGCCGTTPRDIKAMKNAVRSQEPREITEVKDYSIEAEEKAEPVSLAEKSTFGEKLAEDKFVETVEITPPRGWNTSGAKKAARDLRQFDIDAINIPEGPRASSRMGAMGLATVLEEETDVETILHYCCRDRNLLGMQSDLLGAHAIGLRNLLIITGDPPKVGDYPDATAVFDVDSIGLVNVVNHLNQALDIGEKRFDEPTSFVIGVAGNPGATDLDYEVRRFHYKVKAGAEYAITQPVFDTDQFYNFLEEIQSFRIPIIAGIWPLVSLRNAEFMRSEVPGVVIPDEIMSRMEEAKKEDRGLQEGIAIAREILKKIKSDIEGVQISAPFGNYSYALKVLQAIRPEIDPGELEDN